jgi:Protein of unknown function (DUF3592)
MYEPRWTRIPSIIAFLMMLAGFILFVEGLKSWGMFALGGGVMVLVTVHLISQVQFLKRADHAEGVVIDYQKRFSGNDNNNNRLYPVVRYVLPDGRQHTFQAETYLSGIWLYVFLPISKNVDVLYDSLRPEHAIINTFWAKLGGLCVAELGGLAVLVLGCLALMGRVSG